MAKVHLLSAAPTCKPPRLDRLAALRIVEESAVKDRFGVHQTTPEPDQADIILFVETNNDDAGSGPFFEWILRHPVYRKHAAKCFIHSGMDHIVPILRGIYPSIEKHRYDPRRMRSGSYLLKNEFLDASHRNEVLPKWLGSFIGSARSDVVRQRLLKLQDDRLLLKDNYEGFIAAIRAKNTEGVNAFKRQYVDGLLESKFVLCPRGIGVSSIRLFEAMEAQRVPVIYADDWVPPDGPDWDACSIRIAEGDVERTVEILTAAEPRWAQMAASARTEWETWFGDEVIFHRLTETCLLLQKSTHNESLARLSARLNLLHPRSFRRFVRARKRYWRALKNE